MYFSPTVLIANSPPLATNIRLEPAFPTTDEDLSLHYEFHDNDTDTEYGTVIRWFCNNVNVPAYNGALILPSNATCKGDSWWVVVRPADGFIFGNDVSSALITISSEQGLINRVELTPSVYNLTAGEGYV